jgi:hypothetical protein
MGGASAPPFTEDMTMESRAGPGVDVPQPTQAQADEFKEQAHLGGEAPGATAPPVNRDVPHVSGVGTVGAMLTCTMGNWDGEPTSYAYQWRRGTTDIAGTGNTYVVVAEDAGASISCVVTATNDAGSTVAPPSNAVAIAAASDETQTRRK